MNDSKRDVLATLLFVVLGLGLTACNSGSGSGSSSSNVQGNVSVNGNTATSTDTVNGYPVTASITSVSMYGSGYYSGYNSGSSATFQLNLNGVSGQVTAVNVNSSNYYDGTLGNFFVYSTSQVIDSSDVAVVIWVAPNQGYQSSCMQLKQMGVIQNISTGQIRAAIEAVGYESGCSSSAILPTGAALIATMQSVMK